MEIFLLKDIATIFVLSVPVLYFFQRIKVSAIVGFFIIRILAGPGGFSLVKAVSEVPLLAGIGVIFLLFTSGIGFSQLRRSVLLGGSLQITPTFLAVFIITYFTTLSAKESIFIGFLISLSSAAIVLNLFG